MKDKRIIVTGGAGFIGYHTLKKLYLNNEITVIDNLSNGKIENIEEFGNRIKFLKGDVKDFDFLKMKMKDADVVIHLAANPDVRIGEVDTKKDLYENVIGTYNVLEAMRINDIRDIIFSSSSTVYGESPINTKEDYGPMEPISFYGASKLSNEAYISSFSHIFGLRGYVFRFANVIGPRGTHGVIYDFINKLKKNNKILEILGDGTQTKSYLYVNDCVDGMIFGYERSDKNYNVFNLGSEDYINVKRIAEIVVEEMNLKGVKFIFKPGPEGRGWKGDVKTMLLSIEKIKKLGWIPKYKSEDAVRIATKKLLEDLL